MDIFLENLQNVQTLGVLADYSKSTRGTQLKKGREPLLIHSCNRQVSHFEIDGVCFCAYGSTTEVVAAAAITFLFSGRQCNNEHQSYVIAPRPTLSLPLTRLLDMTSATLP